MITQAAESCLSPDFTNPCSRELWSSLPAMVVTVCFILTHTPLPPFLRRIVRSIKYLISPFLTIPESEALTVQGEGEVAEDQIEVLEKRRTALRWRTALVVVLALTQSLLRLAFGGYRFSKDPNLVQDLMLLICSTLPWIYSVVRCTRWPITVVPYDLFTLYSTLFFGALFDLGALVYDKLVFDTTPPIVQIAIPVSNTVVILVLWSIIVTIPMAYPSSKVNPADIGRTVSPEDYCTLWQWITFQWINPLITLGKYTTLHEKDVWRLSPLAQSHPVFVKLMTIQRITLLRRILAANSCDMIFDFILTIVSVFLGYANPFFLKYILAEIEDNKLSRQSLANTYVYAGLALICALLKAQVDAQHLWLGRRAAVRVRSGLMASIYDKALKRKDYSGVANKDPTKETLTTDVSSKKARDKAAKDSASKADDPKAGADIGKIVNLMASDTIRISQIVATITVLYGAPFEIIFAGIFLYQLLGLSAFAGLFVLLLAWPLNRFLVKRRVRIQKGVLAARDKRMGVLSELIRAIKIIKFFAWEDRWIGRVMEQRAVELKWIVKARINSVLFMFMWASAPVFVSTAAFCAYVMTGHKLTISTAFTALALFTMVKSPLNVIPAWTVNLVQARVALDRISVYLAEEEVTEQVCSLKRTDSGAAMPESADLGVENATFKWNQVPNTAEASPSKSGSVSPGTSIVSETATTEASESSSDSEEDEDDRGFRLRDISIIFPENKLTVVTGPTASGKTALLLAVLGEMTLLKGRIIMSKNPSRVDEHGMMYCISYASQSPWLRHQSIKDNILFGYPYEEERYNTVLECCALNPDLDQLEDGDSTEIGARGINLSGGQKARVALARAVYARTKYVLLDDPLSAVDSHTARYLYDRLLCGPLLANRTVVLVTHHMDLVLPGTHYLVHMANGRIDKHGTIEDLRSSGALNSLVSDEFLKPTSPMDALSSGGEAGQGSIENPIAETKGHSPRKLVKDEHREVGRVKWSVYNKYLSASSYWTWITIILLLALRQLLNLGEKLWIKIWGEAYGSNTSFMGTSNLSSSYLSSSYIYGYPDAQHAFAASSLEAPASMPGLPDVEKHPLFYVMVYAAINMLFAVAQSLSGATVFTGALRASRILFKEMLDTVVRATFRLHDTTPQGRILNRFGKDMEVIDSSLSNSVQSVNIAMAGLIASIVIITVIVPPFLIPAFFLSLIYRHLAIGYVNTGRDLRRMESNSRSPIFSDFGELLEGIVTVRAFSVEKRFLNNLHKRVDNTIKMWYSFWMINRWLCLNYDVLGAFFIFITTLFSIRELGDAGLAGICITSAMSFTNAIYWVCRYWTTLELDLNAVERITEYLDLPQEPPAIVPSNRVPAYWPSNTSDALVVVEDLEVRYAPQLPPVLLGISFTLRARERVGILGRTGSGKSTLAMSLLRFVDPSLGRILVDNIDIATIGTYDLRSKMTFIPQDATLFSGTLRDNIDPFDEYEDSECMNALYRVHLITKDDSPRSGAADSSDTETTVVTDSESVTTASTRVTDTKPIITLKTKVSPGGSNFSQGQRQLIALARALLRQSAIIILDEATSSIDFATDTKIQAAIREEFNSSLLITIAHRIRTVIDYDRLIVLDKGKVEEFDTPLTLLNKEGGIFRDMCVKSGSFEELKAAAIAASSK